MSDSKTDYKQCPDCLVMQPLPNFPKNASRRDGYGRYCKFCYSVRYRRHRERKAAAAGKTIRVRRVVPPGRKYCPRCATDLAENAVVRNRSAHDGLTAYCRTCHNAAVRESKERTGGWREYHLRHRYGIGQADVDAMIAHQGGLCAACREDEPKHVDHDHRTGRVRGMLCSLCNQALGNVRDDVTRLQRLIDYLHRCRFAGLGLTIEEFDLSGCVIELDNRRLHAA